MWGGWFAVASIGRWQRPVVRLFTTAALWVAGGSLREVDEKVGASLPSRGNPTKAADRRDLVADQIQAEKLAAKIYFQSIFSSVAFNIFPYTFILSAIVGLSVFVSYLGSTQQVSVGLVYIAGILGIGLLSAYVLAVFYIYTIGCLGKAAVYCPGISSLIFSAGRTDRDVLFFLSRRPSATTIFVWEDGEEKPSPQPTTNEIVRIKYRRFMNTSILIVAYFVYVFISFSTWGSFVRSGSVGEHIIVFHACILGISLAATIFSGGFRVPVLNAVYASPGRIIVHGLDGTRLFRPGKDLLLFQAPPLNLSSSWVVLLSRRFGKTQIYISLRDARHLISLWECAKNSVESNNRRHITF